MSRCVPTLTQRSSRPGSIRRGQNSNVWVCCEATGSLSTGFIGSQAVSCNDNEPSAGRLCSVQHLTESGVSPCNMIGTTQSICLYMVQHVSVHGGMLASACCSGKQQWVSLAICTKCWQWLQRCGLRSFCDQGVCFTKVGPRGFKVMHCSLSALQTSCQLSSDCVLHACMMVHRVVCFSYIR